MTDRLTQALDRSLAVIDALTEGELPFGVLRERAGDLPAPTFSRLIKAMVASGMLFAGQRGYRLAPRLLRTARGVVGGLNAGEMVAEVLAQLGQETGESAAYYAWRGGRLILLAVHTMPDSATYQPIGGSVPELSRHGFAIACAMRASIPEQKAAFERCPRRKERSWTWYRDELAAGRRLGAIIEMGEHRPGILRVASPVGAATVLGAIGVSSPRCERAHAKSLTESVLAAAHSATALLVPGAHP
jgi:DNA-binding IclR family transcriptional regulator